MKNPRNNLLLPFPKRAKCCGSKRSHLLRPLFRRGLLAGMSVEAAVVLPLFLIFFVQLGSAMEMIRLHTNLEVALYDTGNRLAVYGSVLSDEEDLDSSLASLVSGIALSYTYVKNELVSALGSSYLESSPLKAGSSSLQFWESEILCGKNTEIANGILASSDTFELVVTYQVSPVFELLGFNSFRMSNHYYGHFWTGYEISEEATEAQTLVYVAENASVYHTTSSCTHLTLSVSGIASASLDTARNQDGKKYTACEKCCGSGTLPSVVYIATEGTKYHISKTCSGLKRTYSTMTKTQASAAGYGCCSRCGSS